MSIASFLASPHSTAFSFEILPPLRGKNISMLFNTIERLLPFNPAYINITTHRTDVVYKEVEGGFFRKFTQQKRPGCTAIAIALKMKYGITPVPHVICSDYTKTELEDVLIDLSFMGITDLLVLRGDRAAGSNRFISVVNGHSHAIGMCQQVNDFNRGLMIDGTEQAPQTVPFTYGVAGYPEKHEEAMNMDTDIGYLKAKVDAGAKYIVTQMFFDNSKYFNFVDKCRNRGIRVPIIPGIKPLTSLNQRELLPKTFHIDFPEELVEALQRCKSNDDVKAVGIEWGIAQAKELKAANVPSIHFYSMSASTSVEQIAKQVY
ncbi:MAG: methylenetetrahydrofolate reductase [Prevotella sp.]|nr:methylenetetrahydrofolate reductase [Prevotella sp.]